MTKVTFIINGSRKLNKTALDIISELRNNAGFEIVELTSEYGGHSKELAEWAAKVSDIIIAVGGDGTAHEVINGILNSGEDVLFGIIPSGTGNDFLRSTSGFSQNKLLEAVRTKSYRQIDVGEMSNGTEKRYFLNIADVGFGAKVIEKMNRQRKNGLKGKLSYSLAIVRTFLSYKKEVISIEADDFSYSGKALMVAFCNGSTFGHGLTINPGAKIDSGELALTIIGDVSLYEYVKNLGRLKKGHPINHPEVQYATVSTLKIKANKSCLEADGEYCGANISQIRVIPGVIKLLNN